MPPGAHRAWRQRLRIPLDAAVAIAGLIVVLILLFGGIRLFTGDYAVSARSAPRAALLFAALLGLRVLLVREPNVALVWRGWLGRLARASMSAPVRAALPMWIACRIGAVLIGLFAVATIGVPEGAPPRAIPGETLLNLSGRWDTLWYLDIATGGYRWNSAAPAEQQNVAFFPGYPLLMHVGGSLIGARPAALARPQDSPLRYRTRTLAAGWMLSLAASFLMLCALYVWARPAVGAAASARAVALAAAYPFAAFSSAAYPEPVFMLAAIGAFIGLQRQRLGLAALCGLLGGLLRPNGFVLAAPLLILAFQAQPRRVPAYLAALAPGAGLAAFGLYLWSVTGNPLQWMEAHAAWGREMGWDAAVAPARTISEAGLLRYVLASPYDALNTAALLFAVAVIPLVWRTLGAASTAFLVCTLLPPLAAGGVMSIGRLTSTLFPIFVALAAVIRPRSLPAWIIAFAILQGLVAALFFTWRPMV